MLSYQREAVPALLAVFSLELAQELRHFYNRNPAVLSQCRTMARVAADDVIRSSGVRAFKDALSAGSAVMMLSLSVG